MRPRKAANASMLARVNAEAVLLAAGGRALLLQLAHPLVAAGVADHSDFLRRPLARLWRTLELMLTLTFGRAEEAARALRDIERAHARVRGRLRRPAGPWPAGTRYDARDPALRLWVYATLVDSALQVYEEVFGRLSPSARRRYYEEAKAAAERLGIPRALIPPTYRAFRAYMRTMLGRDALSVSPEARRLAAAVLVPPVPVVGRLAAPLIRLLTVGLLPEPIRRRYGLRWGPLDAWLFRQVMASLRVVVPQLPPRLRWFPQARRRT